MHMLRKFGPESKEQRWKRWRIIFDLLEDRHVVPISEIIKVTAAKPAVIEKDIETLSNRGMVRKTAKGGLTLENFHAEKSLEERTAEDQNAKTEVARLAAAKYITDGVTIFTDGSTTVQAIAPFIADRKIKVITNGLSFIADLRALNFAGEIVCLGGTYRSKSNTVVGEHARLMTRELHADLAFLGVEGISSQLELMEAHPEEALLKQAMVEHAKRSIILAMPHKFNDQSLHTFAKLSQIEALVSSSFPDSQFRQTAFACGVRLECPSKSSY